MIIGLPKEICPEEQRVALTPQNIKALCKLGHHILVEHQAGSAANFTNQQYVDAGAELADRSTLFQNSQLIVQVQTPGLNLHNGFDDLPNLKSGQILIGMMDPLSNPEFAQTLAKKNITGISMELIPRITRAQSMDVLSSNAMIAGYKSVLLAASHSLQMFPMNMTAAGTLSPAKVIVMGVGVAGLQACATAKRLGAVVSAYDVRPAAREQILSVGARPVVLELETQDTEAKGGYAKEQSSDFLKQQQNQITKVLAQHDVIITTAAIPGKKSPILVTKEMTESLKPGTVIIDLAAEKGGNCELTKLGEVVLINGIKIVGPNNIASTVSNHSSQMYGKNIENLLTLLTDQDSNINLDFSDEIIKETVVSHQGQVVQARLKTLLGLDINKTVKETELA